MSKDSIMSLKLNDQGPRPVETAVIDVVIDPTVMVDDYAKAFVAEVERIRPRLQERVQLTEEEMIKYCRFLLSQRVKNVLGKQIEWRSLKECYIPVFIQYVMTTVGIVRLLGEGLILQPQMKDEKMTVDEALAISQKLAYFEKDLQMVKDAMPRSKDGDQDTMSCALIAGYVRAMKPVEHPVSTYAAAFLGFKIKEEMAFSMLYRVEYDDLNYIASALLRNKVVMGNDSV